MSGLTATYMSALLPCRKFQTIDRLYRQMRDRSSQVPESAYACAIRARTGRNRPQRALLIWDELMATGAQPKNTGEPQASLQQHTPYLCSIKSAFSFASG